MAQPRSLFHYGHMALAIVLIAAAPLRAQRQTSSTYLQLLDGYRRYDDAVARELGYYWQHLETADERAIGPLIAATPRELSPLSAMALTDLALAALERNDKEVGNRHLSVAQRWVDQMLGKNPGPSMPLNRFARKWYLAAIWLRFGRNEGDDAAKLLERARAIFPNDAEVLLSSGTYEAMELTRRRVERGSRKVTSRGERGNSYGLRAPELQGIKATHYLQDAIKADPNSAEARIRLAWLRFVSESLDFTGELTLLKEARALAPKPPLSYLAALFSGRIEEELKHLDAADVWYRTAIADCPLAQTARLGLSHVQLDKNEIVASRNTLRPLISSPRHDNYVCEPDPWRIYEFGQAWRLTDWIAVMRKDVREPLEGSQP
jgi:tetratricopeptide (TPR) repeat protein